MNDSAGKSVLVTCALRVLLCCFLPTGKLCVVKFSTDQIMELVPKGQTVGVSAEPPQCHLPTSDFFYFCAMSLNIDFIHKQEESESSV